MVTPSRQVIPTELALRTYRHVITPEEAARIERKLISAQEALALKGYVPPIYKYYLKFVKRTVEETTEKVKSFKEAVREREAVEKLEEHVKIRTEALSPEAKKIYEVIVGVLKPRLAEVYGRAGEFIAESLAAILAERLAQLISKVGEEQVKNYAEKLAHVAAEALVRLKSVPVHDLERFVLSLFGRVGRAIERILHIVGEDVERALRELKKLREEFERTITTEEEKKIYESLVEVLESTLVRKFGVVGKQLAHSIAAMLTKDVVKICDLVGPEAAQKYIDYILGQILVTLTKVRGLTPEEIDEFVRKIREKVLEDVKKNVEQVVGEAEKSLEKLSKWAEERLKSLPEDYRKIYEEIYGKLEEKLNKLGRLGLISARAIAALTALAIAEAAREVGLEVARQQIESVADEIAKQLLELGTITPDVVASVVKQLIEKVLSGTEKNLKEILGKVRKRLEELRELAEEYASKSELESKLASEVYSTIYSCLKVGGAAKEAIARALTGAIMSYYEEFKRLVGEEGARSYILQIAQEVAKELSELKSIPLADIDKFVEDFRKNVIEKIVEQLKNTYSTAETSLGDLARWAEERLKSLPEDYRRIYENLYKKAREKLSALGKLGEEAARAFAALVTLAIREAAGVVGLESARRQLEPVLDQLVDSLLKVGTITPTVISELVKQLRDTVLSRTEQKLVDLVNAAREKLQKLEEEARKYASERELKSSLLGQVEDVLARHLKLRGLARDVVLHSIAAAIMSYYDEFKHLVGEEGAKNYILAVAKEVGKALENLKDVPLADIDTFLSNFRENVLKKIVENYKSLHQSAVKSLEEIAEWAKERLSKLSGEYKRIYEKLYEKAKRRLASYGKLGKELARAFAALTTLAISEAASIVGLENARRQIEPVLDQLIDIFTQVGAVSPAALEDLVRQIKEKLLSGTEQSIQSALKVVTEELNKLKGLAKSYAGELLKSDLAMQVYQKIYGALSRLGGRAREALAWSIAGAILSYYDEFKRLVGEDAARSFILAVAKHITDQLSGIKNVPLSKEGIREFVKNFKKNVIEPIINYYKDVYAKAESALADLGRWARTRVTEEFKGLYEDLLRQLKEKFSGLGAFGQRLAEALAALGVAIAREETAVITREDAESEARAIVTQLADQITQALTVSPESVADFISRLKQKVLTEAEKIVRKAVEETLDELRKLAEAQGSAGIIRAVEELSRKAYKEYERYKRDKALWIWGCTVLKYLWTLAPMLRAIGCEVHFETGGDLLVYIPWLGKTVRLHGARAPMKPCSVEALHALSRDLAELAKLLRQSIEHFTLVQTIKDTILKHTPLGRKAAQLLADAIASVLGKYAGFVDMQTLEETAKEIGKTLSEMEIRSLGQVYGLAEALKGKTLKKIEALLVACALANLASEAHNEYLNLRKMGRRVVLGSRILSYLQRADFLLRTFGLKTEFKVGEGGRVRLEVYLPWRREVISLGGVRPEWYYTIAALKDLAEKLYKLAEAISQHYLSGETERNKVPACTS